MISLEQESIRHTIPNVPKFFFGILVIGKFLHTNLFYICIFRLRGYSNFFKDNLKPILVLGFYFFCVLIFQIQFSKI